MNEELRRIEPDADYGAMGPTTAGLAAGLAVVKPARQRKAKPAPAKPAPPPTRPTPAPTKPAKPNTPTTPRQRHSKQASKLGRDATMPATAPLLAAPTRAAGVWGAVDRAISDQVSRDDYAATLAAVGAGAEAGTGGGDGEGIDYDAIRHDRIDIHRLVPNPRNYNEHEEGQIRELIASALSFGNAGVIVVQEQGEGAGGGALIVGGHGWAEALRRIVDGEGGEIPEGVAERARAAFSRPHVMIVPSTWSQARVDGLMVALNNRNSRANVKRLSELLSEWEGVAGAGAGAGLALGWPSDKLALLREDLPRLGDDHDLSLLQHDLYDDNDDLDGAEGLVGGNTAGLGAEAWAPLLDLPAHVTLAQAWIVPPFSVLDSRQGYWQTRKKAWEGLGIQGELGRGSGRGDVGGNIDYEIKADGRKQWIKGLTFKTDSGGDPGYYKKKEEIEIRLGHRITNEVFERDYYQGPTTLGAGTSIFDPVLCELAYRWFTPIGGSVLDPFAGGAVRGIVAGVLGHPYTGIDVNQRQLAANEAQVGQIMGERRAGSELGSLAVMMRGFKHVTPADWTTIAPYYAAFARTRTYPRFYQSPIILSAQGVFYWGILNDCLVVIKRKMFMKTPVMYLILPPMHRSADNEREREVIEHFRGLGISTKLSAEDMALYGYTASDVGADGQNVEYVYDNATWAELDGGDKRHMRTAYNQAQRLMLSGASAADNKAGKIEARTHSGAIAPDVEQGLVALSGRWKTQRSKPNDEQGKHIRQYNGWAAVMHGGAGGNNEGGDSEGIQLTTLQNLDTGNYIAASMIERLTEGHAIITYRLRDYDDTTVTEPTLVLHYLDVGIHQRDQQRTYYNIGSPVRGGQGLMRGKEKLRPVAKLQLYDLTLPVPKLSVESFKLGVPGGAQGSGNVAVAIAAVAGDRPLAMPRYIEGDARDIDKLAPDDKFDLLFVCPPYFNLERYAPDEPRDLSNLKWPEFVAAYRDIVLKSVAKLRADRFAVVVVSDVRDRETGKYWGLVRETQQAFEDGGMMLWGRCVLINIVGSLAMRVGRQFRETRKIGNSHQDVLIFFNGDQRTIAETYGRELDLNLIELADIAPDPDGGGWVEQRHDTRLVDEAGADSEELEGRTDSEGMEGGTTDGT